MPGSIPCAICVPACMLAYRDKWTGTSTRRRPHADTVHTHTYHLAETRSHTDAGVCAGHRERERERERETGPTQCLRRLFCSAAPKAATDCRPESPARRPVPATETAANQLRVRGAAVKACTEGPRSTRRHALAQGIHSALVALSPRLQLPFRSQWRETKHQRSRSLPVYVASRYFQ